MWTDGQNVYHESQERLLVPAIHGDNLVALENGEGRNVGLAGVDRTVRQSRSAAGADGNTADSSLASYARQLVVYVPFWLAVILLVHVIAKLERIIDGNER